jgi:threonine aldolase
MRTVVDLRSDTVTQPTTAMRRAIAEAVVGDEQKREDPTVLELERRGAALVGHEAAVFLPTATMANQIALRVLTRPGDEVIAEAEAHVFRFELGGPAVLNGLAMKRIHAPDGRFTAAQLREAVAPRGDVHTAPTTVVCVENTHNAGGGRVWPLARMREIVDAARELDLAVHLDGARLVNAAVAAGVPCADLGREADTVTLCLSKGLGCPLGAIVAGSAERMERARRFKHLFGGAMRQAGIVAAAGLYALDHNVERIAEDHANAHRLGEGFAEAGIPVDLEQVETNFVQLHPERIGVDREEALERLRAEGVLVSFAAARGVLRAVTHLDVSADDVETAIAAASRAFQRSPTTKKPAATPT